MIRTDTTSNSIRTGLEPFHEYSCECLDDSTTASAAQVILNLAFFPISESDRESVCSRRLFLIPSKLLPLEGEPVGPD